VASRCSSGVDAARHRLAAFASRGLLNQVHLLGRSIRQQAEMAQRISGRAGLVPDRGRMHAAHGADARAADNLIDVGFDRVHAIGEAHAEDAVQEGIAH